ncbi:MAG TPA: aldo/keto reductase [Deltaproteobacteria bacterium]|nr:MAG: aldo/keto reductase [Deltaproteobacteria bacterium GWA2_45_12]HBF12667.1 aldo/keto reductase [Deltaproteobacteria bacterium]
MQYCTFGRTGEKVSEIGHGTWAMGNMWGPRDDRGAIDAMVKALELGVNFIDTAWAYGEGHSEELIAAALNHAKKKKIFIATKVPPKNHQWPARHNTSVQECFPADHIIEYTEKSLKNLRVECVDLQQLHVWSDSWMNDLSWLSAVEKLKSEGKIRFFGVSINDHEPNTALKIVESGLIDSVQVIYNIFDQTPEEKLFPACLKHNVAVIARVPFDEGGLTGNLRPDTVFHKNDWRKIYFKGDRLLETWEHVQKLQFLLNDTDKTMAQAALRFCLSHPAVSTVIPGMRRILHVEQNCAVSNGVLYSRDELAEIKKHAWPRNFYPQYG